MMIGLLLGSVTVAAAATLYKVILLQSVQSKQSSKQDVKTTLGLGALSSLISKAGFGIKNENGPFGRADTDLILLSGAEFSHQVSGEIRGELMSLINSPQSARLSGNALIWSWIHHDIPDTQCSGVVALNGALFKLLPAPCINASESSSISWKTQLITAPRVLPRGLSDADFGYTFTVAFQDRACIPFSAQLGQNENGGVSVDITDFSVVQLDYAANQAPQRQAISAHVCVPNIKKV
jgi:hypothetical protein